MEPKRPDPPAAPPEVTVEDTTDTAGPAPG